jgi:hypothetical protein
MRLNCHPLQLWLQVLVHTGFSARVVDRNRGAAFSNVVLMAHAA